MLKRAKKLHSSSNSSVYLLQDTKDSNVNMVIKHIKNPRSREIELLKRLSHTNIIEVVSYDENPRYKYLVMPNYMQNLKEILPISNTQYQYHIIKEIVNGLLYLHAHKIIHRDIKPQNILISGSKVKITDFGVSRYLKEVSKENTSINTKSSICAVAVYNPLLLDEREFSSEDEISALPENENTKMTGIVGTLNYIPLELLLGSDTYGCEVDLWAAGCTFWEIFFNEICFKGDCEIAQIGEIVTKLGVSKEDKQLLKKYKFSSFIPITPKGSLFMNSGLPQKEQEIFTTLLHLNPAHRTFSTETIQNIVNAEYRIAQE